ncbi:putative hydro-lyase [Thermaerobacter sp. FW80]|uniref:putative hydro-lyase n=1 Tax=Thermaerobacter sp. FW80 TaxID=2546351 RepID=UPI00107562BD|nr:putative hydro-lyase [Thermaerobacter sp. FW80]QBS36656.1 putative hydro-lyase [Thermaerobacter sp. FW80]
MDVRHLSLPELREVIRRGQYTGPTPGLAPGYAQANVVILPQKYAFDFLLFCFRNPKPCPLLDVTDVGSPVPRMVAPEADLRTDVPRYRIWENGVLKAEVTDIRDYWRDDLVGFLLGCSFTFEAALLEAGIPVRHIEEGCNVPMFVTNRPCTPAGVFHGPMVVSMRPIPQEQVVRAVQVTSRFPAVHGAPVHIGDPEALGIRDLAKPDFGDPVTIRPGEVPVFWACGVTPQAVAMSAKPEFMITHAPGHMFITDRKDEELAVL